MDAKLLIAFLDSYPLSSLCFSAYVQWLVNQTDVNNQNNDLLAALVKEDKKQIGRLETLLTRARDILSLTNRDFRNVFGFSKDLFSTDPEKVHDILAEPVLVVNLENNGFTKIRKLSPFIKQAGQRKASCDFIAEYIDKKFAIELKTIRMENNPKPQPGKLSGNALIPEWWNKMLRNNILTKIENKNRKALAQLINAKNIFACDYTMLAIYTRRIGTSTLCDTEDSTNIIESINSQYNEIDFMFLIDYFGKVVISPKLNA